ncbi:hypothetical protein FOXYSP1_10127 [Fusarium oxysporum f. sp. phaseoli]
MSLHVTKTRLTSQSFGLSVSSSLAMSQSASDVSLVST